MNFSELNPQDFRTDKAQPVLAGELTIPTYNDGRVMVTQAAVRQSRASRSRVKVAFVAPVSVKVKGRPARVYPGALAEFRLEMN